MPGREPVQEEHHEAGLRGAASDLWTQFTGTKRHKEMTQLQMQAEPTLFTPGPRSHRRVRSEKTCALDALSKWKLGSPGLNAAQRNSLPGGETL